MRTPEKLRRTLTKVVYLADRGSSDHRIVNSVYIDLSFVGQMDKYIHRVDGGLAPLLVSKNQVNPAMKILRHMLTFEGFSMLANEEICTPLRPWWQADVINDFSSLSHT